MDKLEQVRQALDQGECTQAELAEASGVSQRNVSNIARRVGSPRWDTVEALWQGLQKLNQKKGGASHGKKVAGGASESSDKAPAKVGRKRRRVVLDPEEAAKAVTP